MAHPHARVAAWRRDGLSARILGTRPDRPRANRQTDCRGQELSCMAPIVRVVAAAVARVRVAGRGWREELTT
jgi:hypothetical protein